MEAIQITSYTAEQFQNILTTVVDAAVQKAVEAVSKVKQDHNEEITIKQIAQLWDCSKQTVARRIKDHKVPTVKLGRDVAIKRKFLETIKKPVSKNL